MEVFEQGRSSPIKLGNNEYIASGGEGSIYARGDTAYKIYTDPKKMINPAKIKELSVITSPRVIRPLKVLLDARNNEIGYTMQYLTNTVSLCQTFTKAYRDRVHLTPDMVLKLVQDFQKTVEHVHSNNILIVDLNEMNFMVDDKHREVLFIDVDSYQTRSFPATALMESVRDRHAKSFNTKTDWFAFGIVSFQMFIGIHPYKGKHPTINPLDDRMKQNISVLNPIVGIPKVCYPFTVIPQAYLDWYKAVFEQGKRLAPPTNLHGTVVLTTQVQRLKGSKHFDLSEIFVFPESIVQHLAQDGIRATLTTKAVYKDGKKVYDVSGQSYLGVSKKSAHVFVATVKPGERPALYDTTAGQVLDFPYAVDSMMAYNGRLYFKNGGNISEVEFIEMGKILASPTLVSTVHEKNTKLFEGVAIQNLLGKYFASVFPESKTCYEIPLKEVQGQIVDAKFDSGVLMVIAVKGGKYSRYRFRLTADYLSYDVATVNDITLTGLNFVTLANGICCQITEDEEVHLFKSRKDDAMVKIIVDDHIKGDTKLFRDGTSVLVAQGDTLSTMSMKKNP